MREAFVSGDIPYIPFPDPAQEAALIALGHLFQSLTRGKTPPPWQPLQGLFLWGDVGRGKTRLLNALVRALPQGWALRLHQHEFLHRLHQAIFHQQGRQPPPESPFSRAVGELLGSARLLVLDELHAYDVADAEMLGRACVEARALGATLCFTANHLPAALWPETGAHQSRRYHMDALVGFIGRHCTCLEVDGGRDYRVTPALPGDKGPLRWWPGDGVGAAEVAVWVCGGGSSGRVFGFAELCGEARSHGDLSRLLDGVGRLGITHLPAFAPSQGDSLRRFLWLLDIAWERQLPLAISAATSPATLLQGIGPVLAQFLDKDLARAMSRLLALAAQSPRE